jgi:hypothetical protein
MQKLGFVGVFVVEKPSSTGGSGPAKVWAVFLRTQEDTG